MRYNMDNSIQNRIPFSNSPKLHDDIGNKKTDKKELAKAAFRNAEEFYTGAGVIFKICSVSLIQVVFVNLAFSCELYLKAMLYELDIDFGKTHRIIDLYNMLPVLIKTKIKSNVQFPNDKAENFELVMEEISDSFVFQRYAHERKMIVGNWGGLLAITDGVKKVSKEVVEKEQANL